MPPPRLRPVDVNELVRAALKAFEPQFRAVGRPPITPELYLESSVSKIQADEDLLRKAMENLLAHSIDAMPTGGLLTIRTGHANGFVRIEVSGSGAGAVQLESARPRPFGASRMRPAAAGPGNGPANNPSDRERSRRQIFRRGGCRGWHHVSSRVSSRRGSRAFCDCAHRAPEARDEARDAGNSPG